MPRFSHLQNQIIDSAHRVVVRIKYINTAKGFRTVSGTQLKLNKCQPSLLFGHQSYSEVDLLPVFGLDHNKFHNETIQQAVFQGRSLPALRASGWLGWLKPEQNSWVSNSTVFLSGHSSQPLETWHLHRHGWEGAHVFLGTVSHQNKSTSWYDTDILQNLCTAKNIINRNNAHQ